MLRPQMVGSKSNTNTSQHKKETKQELTYAIKYSSHFNAIKIRKEKKMDSFLREKKDVFVDKYLKVMTS